MQKEKVIKQRLPAFTWPMLILYIGIGLFPIVGGLVLYLKGRDREFQGLVSISGVMEGMGSNLLLTHP